MTASEAAERLQTFLQRAGSCPLNIKWHDQDETNGDLHQILGFVLLENTSLSQWHSLGIGRVGEIPPEKLTGSFSGLKRLTVWHDDARSILNRIEQTANCLEYLELIPGPDSELLKENNLLLSVVGPSTILQTYFVESQLLITHAVEQLSVNFTVTSGPTVLLPLIKELRVTVFGRPSSILGRCFTNLKVLVLENCFQHYSLHITLPLLQILTFGGPDYSYLSYIDAPNLQTLRLMPPGTTIYPPELQTLTDAIDSPTYQLSPSTLHIGIEIETTTLVQLLALSPSVTHLSLVFSSGSSDWTLLSSLLHRNRRVAITETMHLQKWELCERLSTLQIELDWVPTQTEIEDGQKFVKQLQSNRAFERVDICWR